MTKKFGIAMLATMLVGPFLALGIALFASFGNLDNNPNRDFVVIAALVIGTIIICAVSYLMAPSEPPVMTEQDIEVERWNDWFGRPLTPAEEMRLRELLGRRDIARLSHQRQPSRQSLDAWKAVHAEILQVHDEIATDVVLTSVRSICNIS